MARIEMARLRALLLLPALASCTVGPDFERPSVFSPASWFRTPVVQPVRDASLPVAEPVAPRWWETFHEPVLTSLVTRAAEANLDVRSATARLAQSRAQRGITGADQYPSLNANGSYTREKSSEKGVTSLIGGGSPAGQANGLGGRQGGTPTGGGALASPFDLFQLGFDASWELDIWGRVRRSIEGAEASLQASEDDRRNTVLSAVAEVARDYLQLRGTQDSLRITEANLRTAEDSVRLTRERAAGGVATDLDAANAAAQAATTSAQLPQLRQQEAQLINAIGVLLALPPAALRDELQPAKHAPSTPPRIPVGVPSELLQRRPDIRQAEAQLHAATANIGAARADFFPRITLTGSFAFQSLQLRDLADWGARSYGLGPSVTLPVFDGGRRRATLQLREAQQQEAAAGYQRAVLNAFREVDDALTAYAAEQARRDALATAVRENRRALDLSTMRYRQGLATYLDVLTAQRGVLAAEQSLADSTATVGTNLVALYKALGGGWEETYPDERADLDSGRVASIR